LKTRYSILKWYYSLFVETGGAGSIFRPLMFEFPNEDALYNDGFTDWEFLLGKSVLCTPKVEQGEPHVIAYFPSATWYDLFTGQRFIDKTASERTKRVETPYNSSVPMFLRGGHIVHRQAVDNVLSTADLNNEFELIVGLDRESANSALSAKGSMMGIESFDDDSVYDRCVQDNCLYDITVTVPLEDVTSVSVEIRFKRQKLNVRRMLDGFNLKGLKLYGLPLDFMAEDESKMGFGLIQLSRGDGEDFTSLGMGELISIEDNAFSFDFETPLRIEDGDILKLELLI
jgi:alpha-glucosidase (family GH31 glycosyl hydrolase)